MRFRTVETMATGIGGDISTTASDEAKGSFSSAAVCVPGNGGRSAGRDARRRKAQTPPRTATATPAPGTSERLVCRIRSPTSRSVSMIAKTTIVTTPPA